MSGLVFVSVVAFSLAAALWLAYRLGVETGRARAFGAALIRITEPSDQ
jgi:hypothetical protein